MKYCLILFCVLIAHSVFAQCNINQQKFGTSLRTMENKIDDFKKFEHIPDVQQQITTILEEICPELEKALSRDTLLYYHFIKNRLVSIQLERVAYDDLLLFEWARKYFGIVQERKINETNQMIQVEKGDRTIRLLVSVLPGAVQQNVLIISNKHDDLFEFLARKVDEIDWMNYEIPEPE